MTESQWNDIVMQNATAEREELRNKKEVIERQRTDMKFELQQQVDAKRVMAEKERRAEKAAFQRDIVANEQRQDAEAKRRVDAKQKYFVQNKILNQQLEIADIQGK